MGLQWFRCYVDFLEDPKMISIAFEDQRHFLAICALKAAGTLDQNCTPEMLNRIVAQKIWVDYSIVTDVKKRLQDAGLIDEFWQPVAWDKRQSKSDSSAERVRKHREKKQQLEACNVTETLQKRKSNAPEENRIEENRKEKIPTPSGVDASLWDDFLKQRKKLKATNSPRAVNALINKLEELKSQGDDPQQVVEASYLNAWKSFYPLKNKNGARPDKPITQEFKKGAL